MRRASMKSRLEHWLLQRWYGGVEPGLGLRLLAAIYGFVVGLRQTAYRQGWLRTHRISVPVVVVGNRTVGGSGKTPLVIALVEHLRANGWKPGVVSRGYGRSSRGQRVVDASTRPDEGGDEPVLIARRCNVPVVVHADRVAAARKLIELGCDVVVADDGLQHYRLQRDFEIEVVEAGRRYGNEFLLPAGPLREPLGDQLFTCSRMQVRNGTDARPLDWPDGVAGYHFYLIGDSLVNCENRSEPLSSWHGRRVHAVAGIGHPQRFFDSLRLHGLDPVPHAFPDHHVYTADDLQFDEPLPIVMTEKDWVKCTSFLPADAWMLPVQAECSDGLLTAFLTQFEDATGHHRG